jgi:hypothetical protein
MLVDAGGRSPSTDHAELSAPVTTGPSRTISGSRTELILRDESMLFPAR